MKPKKETWTRHTVIDSEMVGKCYSVYNGSRFVPVTPRKRDIGNTLLSVATGSLMGIQREEEVAKIAQAMNDEEPAR